MKRISRFLSVFLVLALTLSCSACSSGIFSAAEEEENVEELIIDGDNMPEVFIPMTEKTSKSGQEGRCGQGDMDPPPECTVRKPCGREIQRSARRRKNVPGRKGNDRLRGYQFQ